MNKSDRCDKCGHEALARVRSVLTLKELMFCGHHLNQHAAALDSAQWYVVSRKPAEPKEEAVPA